ncbi:hypothetical protein I1A62_37375 [Rhodococcus sp. USK10]|uniref:hypothetical protein n=1 Tax=Rhodococcus sp. USK10 TaxID=2789739 RepID=UPI001C5E17C9|nr:hypothetical protein [Rhodococcus sp. USK10]QYB02798.1 hypothetical protein I1A62_37375 [Rhodococcus sp. USK10]
MRTAEPVKNAAFWLFMAIALVIGGGLYWAAESRGPSDTSYTPVVVEPKPWPGAIFLGDSYTAGSRAGGEGARYTTIVCNQLKWRCEVNRQGGTGYTNMGQPEENETKFVSRNC